MRDLDEMLSPCRTANWPQVQRVPTPTPLTGQGTHVGRSRNPTKNGERTGRGSKQGSTRTPIGRRSSNNGPESTPTQKSPRRFHRRRVRFAGGEGGDQKQRREDLIRRMTEHSRDQREDRTMGRSGSLTLPGDLRRVSCGCGAAINHHVGPLDRRNTVRRNCEGSSHL